MKAIHYFYYHHLDNPTIEYCVYVDMYIKSFTIDNKPSTYVNIKNILNEMYQVFLIDNNIQINSNYSIFEQNLDTLSNVPNIVYYNSRNFKGILDSLYIINSRNKKNNITEWGHKYNIESSWSSNLKHIINNPDKEYKIERIERYTRIHNENIHIFEKNYDNIIHDNFTYLKGKLNSILNNLSNTKKFAILISTKKYGNQAGGISILHPLA